MERQPLSFCFTVSNTASFLSSQSEQTVDLSSIWSTNLLPSREEAQRVQAGQLWHIKDILYDAFPSLRKRLASSILPPPSVQQIPVHKIEQYPLPAMHVDESSLEGTSGVMSTTFRSTLELGEDDIKKHGLVICPGDQLSLALLDKVCICVSVVVYSTI